MTFALSLLSYLGKASDSKYRKVLSFSLDQGEKRHKLQRSQNSALEDSFGLFWSLNSKTGFRFSQGRTLGLGFMLGFMLLCRPGGAGVPLWKHSSNRAFECRLPFPGNTSGGYLLLFKNNAFLVSKTKTKKKCVLKWLTIRWGLRKLVGAHYF